MNEIAVVSICLLVAFLLGAALGYAVAAYRSRLELAVAHAQAEHATSLVETTAAQDHRAAELAEKLGPLSSALTRLERQTAAAHADRAQSWGQLTEQLRTLDTTTRSLNNRTASLSTALTSAPARGVWGEIHLRRALEQAGLAEHTDFDMQVTARAGDAVVRPDAVIRLPGGRSLVVDAKAPMTAFLQATTPDTAPSSGHDTAEPDMRDHAKAVKAHVTALSAKKYWEAFDPAPECVVCFLPAEAMLTAAISAAPDLLEFAAKNRVALATPATLIAVLQAVAGVWRQERVAENVAEVFAAGKELHDRLGSMTGHIDSLRASLTRAVGDYNKLVGSTQSRVYPALRTLEGLGVASTPIADLTDVTAAPRRLTFHSAETHARALNDH